MARRYDYYTVNVPSDYSEDPTERADQAFREAEAITRLWCVPCEWRIVSDNGEDVRVCRVRNQRA